MLGQPADAPMTMKQRYAHIDIAKKLTVPLLDAYSAMINITYILSSPQPIIPERIVLHTYSTIVPHPRVKTTSAPPRRCMKSAMKCRGKSIIVIGYSRIIFIYYMYHVL
jgi:hypothetical protein